MSDPMHNPVLVNITSALANMYGLSKTHADQTMERFADRQREFQVIRSWAWRNETVTIRYEPRDENRAGLTFNCVLSPENRGQSVYLDFSGVVNEMSKNVLSIIMQVVGVK